MRNAECGVPSSEWGMGNVECGMRNVECGFHTPNSQLRIPNSKLHVFRIFLCFILLATVARAQEHPAVLLQAGLYAEEIEGDLSKALEHYQKIISDYPESRSEAAEALLRMGFCYEKLGKQADARETYQKLLSGYPGQHKGAAIARDRLAEIRKSEIPNRKSQIEIHPLTRHYFQRFGIDLLTSTSYEGKYFAYTDWTTGSLMVVSAELGVRNGDTLRTPHSALRIVPADFSRSHEYAYYPAFSRDGKTIAYSWYRGPYWVELRTVSLQDGAIRVLHSKPGLILNPHDWTPDGQAVVCETLDFEREVLKRLGLVRVDNGTLQEIIPLDRNSRGMTVSADGGYVVYDLVLQGQRNIYVLDLQTGEQSQKLFGVPGYLAGWDGPVWSPQGDAILARNIGSFELWMQPFADGRRVGKATMIQSDLRQAMLAWKENEHVQLPPPKNPTPTADAHTDFTEEFDDPTLDPAWQVWKYTGPNLYETRSFGRYSLTDRPGYLRYYLDASSAEAHGSGYHPMFTGWYWQYPSLEISRPLYGDHWLLEARATYSLVSGANGRRLTLVIYLDDGPARETRLVIVRNKDIGPESNHLSVHFIDRGTHSENFISQRDTLDLGPFTYTYRITRADTLIKVQVSDNDGATYRELLVVTLRPELRGRPQRLALTGGAWFVPAGSYADWDYVRFRVLK